MELARICEGYIYSAWVVIRGRVYSKPASERLYLNRVLGVLYRGSLTAFTVLGIISSIYQLRFFVREQLYLHYSFLCTAGIIRDNIKSKYANVLDASFP